MFADILLAAGGLGLFLLGMIVLTDGLRRVAGRSLRNLLATFTRTPLRGAAAGALTTAVVQSSSATTVTVVGFVGAGLLTFPQGLGVVFGANIGTTITGWMVAIVGFKLDLGLVVLPLVLAGVLLRLFTRSSWQHIGWALAGFGLLFVGIDAMQAGMARFEGVVTPADFPDDTLPGRFLLVLVGIAVTLVTQSSSAGVAAALVAMAAGSISFAQAAALVIGMDVGTTFTAALATLGGSTAARRTGYAHVIYNLLTGAMAFFLLGVYADLVTPWIMAGAAGSAQIALVGFHTAFNTLGVIIVIPFARPFGRLVARLVRERGPALLSRLDAGLLGTPASAVDAAAATVRDIAVLLIAVLADAIDPADGHASTTRLVRPNEALVALRDFVEQIRTRPEDEHVHRRHLEIMHAMDHLQRLSHRCGQAARIETLDHDPRLRRLTGVLHGAVARLLEDENLAAAELRFDRIRSLLREERRRFRARTLTSAAEQDIDAEAALRRLDSVRWLHRVAYHLWRIAHHLRRAGELEPARPEQDEAALEIENE